MKKIIFFISFFLSRYSSNLNWIWICSVIVGWLFFSVIFALLLSIFLHIENYRAFGELVSWIGINISLVLASIWIVEQKRRSKWWLFLIIPFPFWALLLQSEDKREMIRQRKVSKRKNIVLG